MLQAPQEGGQGQYREVCSCIPCSCCQSPERPSYAGAVVEVLEGLDGQLRVRHEGRIINAQEAPPSPAFLRNGHEGSPTPLVSPAGSDRLNQRLVDDPQVGGLKGSG